jgi:hypothetical protein
MQFGAHAVADNTRSDGLSSASFAIQQLRRVVLDVPYISADLEGFHLVGGEGAQQVYRWTRWIGVAVKPAVTPQLTWSLLGRSRSNPACYSSGVRLKTVIYSTLSALGTLHVPFVEAQPSAQSAVQEVGKKPIPLLRRIETRRRTTTRNNHQQTTAEAKAL